MKENCLYSDSVYIDFIIGNFYKTYVHFSFIKFNLFVSLKWIRMCFFI